MVHAFHQHLLDTGLPVHLNLQGLLGPIAMCRNLRNMMLPRPRTRLGKLNFYKRSKMVTYKSPCRYDE